MDDNLKKLFKVKDIIDCSNSINKQIDEVIYDINVCANYLFKYNRIIISANNSYYWILAFFGCLIAGKEVYLLDKDENLEHFVDEIDPDLIISDTECNYNADHMLINKILHESNSIVSETIDENQYTKCKVVLYTTGTTHQCMGIVFTYEHLIAPAYSQIEGLNINLNDIVAILPPFSHAFGLSVLLASILSSEKIYIVNNSIDLVRLLTRKEKINCIFVPPIFLTAIMNSAEYTDSLKELKMIGIGGAKLNEKAIDFYYRKGINVISLYGSTETGMCYIGISNIESHFKQFVLSGCMQMKVDYSGELLVKGRNLGAHTIKNNLLVDDDGWFHTGDMVKECEMHFEIMGRKDAIKVLNNSHKINLEEIANKIMDICGINACEVKVVSENEIDKIVLYVSSLYSKNIDVGKINSSLNYYERISRVEWDNGIKRKRGKVVR